jgi:hypothetical protein
MKNDLSWLSPLSILIFSGCSTIGEPDEETEDLRENLYFKKVTSYYNDQNFENEVVTAAAYFEFSPEPVDFYIFKFWQGRDDQSGDNFLTHKVPVESNRT